MSAGRRRAPRPARGLGTLAVLALLASMAGAARAEAGCSLRVDAREAQALAERVWRNESGGDLDKILWWNPGETFASVGIGHFIWYPRGVDGPFRESFPELVGFLVSRGVAMPAWLAAGCPWPTRAVFLAERNGPRASELRRLLVDTIALQAEFMLTRLDSALAAMLAGVPAEQARVLEARFCALAATPGGRYALLDYVNFKGEGTNPGERYRGEGWGVKQVLEAMRGSAPATEDFAAAAARVLERRVRNAPRAHPESRWLPGWLRRVRTYAEPM